jgi:hypothetical protein
MLTPRGSGAQLYVDARRLVLKNRFRSLGRGAWWSIVRSRVTRTSEKHWPTIAKTIYILP